jgi:chemotaxis protein CheX
MTHESHPMPTDADLWSMVEMVWTSYLDPDGANPLMPATVVPGPGDMAGTVSVSGAWHGRVVVTFSPAASQHATAALLGIEVEEVSAADVADAVGELANIVGGSVKSLMPQPTTLSLPSVRTGGFPADDATEICRLTATWLDEPVSVAVLESAAEYVGVSRTGAPHGGSSHMGGRSR